MKNFLIIPVMRNPRCQLVSSLAFLKKVVFSFPQCLLFLKETSPETSVKSWYFSFLESLGHVLLHLISHGPFEAVSFRCNGVSLNILQSTMLNDTTFLILMT